MKKRVISILMVLIVLILAGCSKKEDASVPSAVPETRVVIDQMGTEVTLPVNVEKVANFWFANNQIQLLLGAADKLVATINGMPNYAWYCKVYPRMATMPELADSKNVNLEELYKLEPDVVLTSSAGLAEICRNAGLAVVYIMFQDFDGLKETIRIDAEVFGGDAPARADRFFKYLDKNISLVAERTKDIPIEDRPTVMHIVNGTNLLKIDGTDCIINEWIKLAGGRNGLDIEGNMKVVTIEEILKADPEYIIVGGGLKTEGKKKIMADPAWANLTAVKTGKVFSNPQGVFHWDRYSSEEALQVIWAAKLLHPDLFKDVDIVKETKYFYKEFFDYELSDEDAQRIIDAGEPEL